MPSIRHLSASAEIDWSLPQQRTQKGLKYESFMKTMREEMVDAEDPEVKEANDEIIRCKDLKPGDVHQSTVLNSMSVMYANDDYIGLRLMPELRTGNRAGIYYKYNKRDRFAYPDDSMSTRTEANEVSEGRTTGTYSLSGRALKEFVDQTTLNNQDAPLNEMMDAQNNVLEGVTFKQEVRIASAVTTAGNYAGNTAAIAAPDRWDTATGGDPINDINTALAARWNGRGPGRVVAATSLTVWNVLKVHPRLLDLIRGNRDGMLSREMFAQWFEIDELLIGKARKDTANEGQTASYSRIWPDSFAIVRVATSPSIRNASFGYSVMEKAPVQRMWFDPKSGEEGGWYTQASLADQQLVVAGDTGYLLTTPVG
jgi:hypothetical protein